MKTQIILLFAVFLVIGMVGSARAEIIFEDDFDRGKTWTVGNDWSEVETASVHVAISFGGHLMLGDQNGAMAFRPVSLSGYENISVEFEYSVESFSTDVTTYAEYDQTDGNWTGLWSVGPDFGPNSMTYVNLNLPNNIANPGLFRFRFGADADGYPGDGARIDYVKISGSIISVPEPSLGLLLGISLIGLVGVGAVRRIKQNKEVANS